jgi:hypothetical protein
MALIARAAREACSAAKGRRGGAPLYDWCSVGTTVCGATARKTHQLPLHAILAGAAVVAATTGMLPWAFRFAPDCENTARWQRSLSVPNRRYLLRFSANLRTTLGEVLTLLRLVSVALANQPASALQAAVAREWERATSCAAHERCERQRAQTCFFGTSNNCRVVTSPAHEHQERILEQEVYATKNTRRIPAWIASPVPS